MASVASSLRLPRISRNAGLVLLFIVELAIIGMLVPGYLSAYGLLDASRQFAESGLIALGMTLIIITGGIDLSVGALLALVSVTIGFGFQAGLPLGAALLAGIGVGAAGGFFNGVMVTSLRLHPLVVTLATFALYRGIAFAISDGDAVSNFPQWFGVFGQQSIAGLVPVQLICFALLAAAFAVLLARTAFGRRLYAIGNSERAAHFSGVNTAAVKVAVYTLTGILVALASVIYTSRISSARANAGYGLELTVIAMVVLGGTKITGGAGTVFGTVMGVLILSYLQDGLSYAGVRSDWGLIVTGAFLIVAVLVNEIFRRRG
jgi:rhamnose transport system permease protein